MTWGRLEEEARGSWGAAQRGGGAAHQEACQPTCAGVLPQQLSPRLRRLQTQHDVKQSRQAQPHRAGQWLAAASVSRACSKGGA